MKHFPAERFHPPLAGATHPERRRPLARSTTVLLCATSFAGGFVAALWIAYRIISRT